MCCACLSNPKYRIDHIKEYWDDFYLEKAQKLIKKKMKAYAAKFDSNGHVLDSTTSVKYHKH
ncbi:hypothetical protein EVJ58_g7841 [Rhodofomes roseus]|uniref:Uncharacterized protein n=1 Tax=Rhodofomes roseus TaxID=34475 RepID=A0A4Y9Y1Z7_9APHY|nr:hypothetical protein EVJ58_g7841 [Rhodofomes roseus]